MEINVKEVWLLNKFAKEIHHSRLDKFRTLSNASFLMKLSHHNRKEGLIL